MTSFGKKVLCMLVLAVMASSGWAVPISTVGGVDELKGQTDDLGCAHIPGQGSSPEKEVCWVNTVLGTSFSSADFAKQEDVSYQVVTDTLLSLIAFELPTDPNVSHFLIKNSVMWAVFENVSSLDWAVINTALLDSRFNLPNEDLEISHILAGGPVTVPEPGTTALLGAALIALTAIRRRRGLR